MNNPNRIFPNPHAVFAAVFLAAAIFGVGLIFHENGCWIEATVVSGRDSKHVVVRDGSGVESRVSGYDSDSVITVGAKVAFNTFSHRLRPSE